MFDLIVKDAFVTDISALRADVLAKGFQTVTNPADGLEYSGVQVRDPQELQAGLAELVGFPVKVATHVARIHLKGDAGRDPIHWDSCMSEYGSVLYLPPPGAPFTGTAFFTDKLTGWSEVPDGVSDLDVQRLGSQSRDINKWSSNGFVGAIPGRLVAYPCKKFHSRFPFEGFGETPETARLVIVSFFNRA